MITKDLYLDREMTKEKVYLDRKITKKKKSYLVIWCLGKEVNYVVRKEKILKRTFFILLKNVLIS